MTIAREETPVLIAGAGPAGMTVAIELARRGVESLLVERRSGPSSLPKATTVSLRTMEIVRGWGLEEAVRAGGPEVEWEMWISETLAAAADGFAVPAGIPTNAASALVSPTTPACVPQDHLESVLLGHLRTMPVARTRHATELIDLEERDGGYAAMLRGQDGRLTMVDARYVIAADGAHSMIRERLGIPRRETGELEHAQSVLFRAPLWDLLGDVRYGLYAPDQPTGGIFLPGGLPDRWIYGLLLSGEQATDPARIDLPELLRRIEIASGVPGLQVEVERTGSFSFIAGIAERFRRGNAFLVGDAAHRVTPRGGTGMNMAIHGAFALGWRLAWVLRGWAGPEILDAYEAERRPLVEHNIARSTDPEGSRAEPSVEMQVDLGGRIPHAWTSTGSGRSSVLDLPGEALTLLAEEGHADSWAFAADFVVAGPPVVLRRIDPMAARVLGIAGGAAMLVRPDAVQAAWLPAGGGEQALDAALATSLGAGRREMEGATA